MVIEHFNNETDTVLHKYSHLPAGKPSDAPDQCALTSSPLNRLSRAPVCLCL